MDFFFVPPLTQTTAFWQSTRNVSLGYLYVGKLSAENHVILPSLRLYRGNPEIIGSNLDVLVTVGLTEKVGEDYRLAQEICNAISKLASHPKVRVCSRDHPETEERREVVCIEKREK